MTEISRGAHDLHMTILWVCAVIAILVFGAMIYSIATFRKSPGVSPAMFRRGTTVEILWAIVPILILVGMAVPAVRTLVIVAAPTTAHSIHDDTKSAFHDGRGSLQR